MFSALACSCPIHLLVDTTRIICTGVASFPGDALARTGSLLLSGEMTIIQVGAGRGCQHWMSSVILLLEGLHKFKGDGTLV